MEEKSVKIVLTEEELDQINGGFGVIKKVEGMPVVFSISSAGGKDEPGKNKIFK